MRKPQHLMNVLTAAALLAFGGSAFAADLGAVPSTPEGGWQLPGGTKNVAGDVYWNSTGSPPVYPSAGTTWSQSDIQADRLNSPATAEKASVPRIRAEAIQEAAASFGTQAGLAHVAQQINAALQARSTYYDQAFNFDAVELEPGFIPPVISEGRNAYNQPNANEVRAADTIYKIEFPARLANVPPRWQDYLMQPFTNPELPHPSMLPKTSAEKALWNEWVNKGWAEGERQGWDNFESARGRLKRDFEGMVRFKSLYVQGLVDKPILARSTLGVTGGNNQMAINDRLVRITKPAQFNPDTKRWLTPAPK